MIVELTLWPYSSICNFSTDDPSMNDLNQFINGLSEITIKEVKFHHEINRVVLIIQDPYPKNKENVSWIVAKVKREVQKQPLLKLVSIDESFIVPGLQLVSASAQNRVFHVAPWFFNALSTNPEYRKQCLSHHIVESLLEVSPNDSSRTTEEIHTIKDERRDRSIISHYQEFARAIELHDPLRNLILDGGVTGHIVFTLSGGCRTAVTIPAESRRSEALTQMRTDHVTRHIGLNQHRLYSRRQWEGNVCSHAQTSHKRI